MTNYNMWPALYGTKEKFAFKKFFVRGLICVSCFNQVGPHLRTSKGYGRVTFNACALFLCSCSREHIISCTRSIREYVQWFPIRYYILKMHGNRTVRVCAQVRTRLSSIFFRRRFCMRSVDRYLGLSRYFCTYFYLFSKNTT